MISTHEKTQNLLEPFRNLLERVHPVASAIKLTQYLRKGPSYRDERLSVVIRSLT